MTSGFLCRTHPPVLEFVQRGLWTYKWHLADCVDWVQANRRRPGRGGEAEKPFDCCFQNTPKIHAGHWTFASFFTKFGNGKSNTFRNL